MQPQALQRSAAEKGDLQRRNHRLRQDSRRAAQALHAALRLSDEAQLAPPSAAALAQGGAAERAVRDAKAVEAHLRRAPRAARAPPPRAVGGAHWSAAAEDVPGLHGTRDEAAWLEPELAALPGRRPARATRPASAAPVRRMEAGRGGGSDEDALKQLLTHALGEEVHRALLTEVLAQKAGTEFAG